MIFSNLHEKSAMNFSNSKKVKFNRNSQKKGSVMNFSDFKKTACERKKAVDEFSGFKKIKLSDLWEKV